MQKNRPAMNYDKLSRSLRYYYEKGIMQKVRKPHLTDGYINSSKDLDFINQLGSDRGDGGMGGSGLSL